MSNQHTPSNVLALALKQTQNQLQQANNAIDVMNEKTSQALAITYFIQQHYEDNGYDFQCSGETVNNALWAVTSLLREASKAQEGLNNA